MAGRFRVGQPTINRDQIPVMPNDAADALTLRASSRVIELFGLPFERLLGKSPSQLLPEPVRQLFDLRESNVFGTLIRAES
jgi:hypothetical protein